VISGDIKAVQRATDLHATAFLTKPFELDDILSRITAAAPSAVAN